MNIQRILFPTDFSSASDAALEQATALARDSNATLLIVHVEEPALAYSAGEMYYGVLDPDHAELREMLHAVAPTDPEVTYEHHLVSGDPAEAIVHLAEVEHVDLVVMSTHGRSGLRRLLMGSVAEKVVRRAPCPVFTLRQPHATVTAAI
jgi:nucleotide-binding universal stress UspA family protein